MKKRAVVFLLATVIVFMIPLRNDAGHSGVEVGANIMFIKPEV
jgi:hypothetical protein